VQRLRRTLSRRTRCFTYHIWRIIWRVSKANKFLSLNNDCSVETQHHELSYVRTMTTINFHQGQSFHSHSNHLLSLNNDCAVETQQHDHLDVFAINQIWVKPTLRESEFTQGHETKLRAGDSHHKLNSPNHHLPLQLSRIFKINRVQHRPAPHC
jgi:hypothetical protein